MLTPQDAIALLILENNAKLCRSRE